jgi:hypothetical protein
MGLSRNESITGSMGTLWPRVLDALRGLFR